MWKKENSKKTVLGNPLLLERKRSRKSMRTTLSISRLIDGPTDELNKIVKEEG